MSAAADDLRAARARIASGWTQRKYARTADGYDCAPYSELATRWCARGALIVDEDVDRREGPHIFLARAIKALWPENEWARPGMIEGVSIPQWNDWPGRTQADVLRAYDKAIELALAEGK